MVDHVNRESQETGDDGSSCPKVNSVLLCLCSAWPLNSTVCRPVGCSSEMLTGRDAFLVSRMLVQTMISMVLP